MSYLSRFIVRLFLIVCLFFPCSTLAAQQFLTILHTNDHHGHFMKFNPYPVADVGGLSAQSALVNIVRAEASGQGHPVLLLSAGDINTGIPESDLQDARPDIEAMNRIGYDAMALGNHEFDNARATLQQQMQWAEFPFLSANIFKKGTDEPLVTPYIIKEIDKLRVAIIGLTTPDTPRLALAQNVADIEFRDPIQVAAELVPGLRSKADLIIVLSHLGFYEDPAKGGDLALAKAVPGIDIIVGGHTHTALSQAVVVGKTRIVQAGSYAEYVGRIDISIDSDTGQISSASALLPVNMKQRIKYNDKSYYEYLGTGYVEDEELLKLLQPYVDEAKEKLSQPIAQAAVALIGADGENRREETNLANLITDSMRAKTGAEIALLNGGSIRSGINPGTISYRDVLSTMPFANTLVVLKMTGAEITDTLRLAATKIGSGGFMQVAGLHYTVSGGQLEKVAVNGKTIEPQKIYSVVTNSFVGSGGDGYTIIEQLDKEDTGFVDADVFKDYITAAGTVAPELEGRIVVKQ